jgi:hypothetical protein
MDENVRSFCSWIDGNVVHDVVPYVPRLQEPYLRAMALQGKERPKRLKCHDRRRAKHYREGPLDVQSCAYR